MGFFKKKLTIKSIYQFLKPFLYYFTTKGVYKFLHFVHVHLFASLSRKHRVNWTLKTCNSVQLKEAMSYKLGPKSNRTLISKNSYKTTKHTHQHDIIIALFLFYRLNKEIPDDKKKYKNLDFLWGGIIISYFHIKIRFRARK